jgi:hypothetical protein
MTSRRREKRIARHQTSQEARPPLCRRRLLRPERQNFSGAVDCGALTNEACRTSNSSPETTKGEAGYLTSPAYHTTNGVLVNIKSIGIVDLMGGVAVIAAPLPPPPSPSAFVPAKSSEYRDRPNRYRGPLRARSASGAGPDVRSSPVAEARPGQVESGE